jgi:apolipoprotein N-acyltransferase
MEQSRQNFSLLVKNLDLELKNDKKLQQHISQLMLLATNPHENAEIRLMVLKETLPAMFKTQQQNAQQRHAVLIQQLQNPLLLNNNKQALLLN